jgi:hypothetical protein
VACAARSVALDERRGAEVLQARPRAGQGLATAARARCRVLITHKQHLVNIK